MGVDGTILDKLIEGLIAHSQQVGLIIGGTGATTVVAYAFVKESFNGHKGRLGSMINWEEIARVFGLIFIIMIFGMVIHPLTGAVISFGDMLSYDTDAYNKMEVIIRKGDGYGMDQAMGLETTEEIKQKMAAQMVAAHMTGNGTAADLGIWEFLKMIVNGKIFAYFLIWIGKFLTFLIKDIVSSVALTTLKVLIVMGPIAFGLSVFPFLKSSWQTWSAAALNTAFVFVVFGILDSIIMFHDIYFAASVRADTFGGSMPGVPGANVDWSFLWDELKVNITLIALYISVFKLASSVVGTNIAGSITAAGAGVSALGVKAMGAGAKAVAGGGKGG